MLDCFYSFILLVLRVFSRALKIRVSKENIKNICWHPPCLTLLAWSVMAGFCSLHGYESERI